MGERRNTTVTLGKDRPIENTEGDSKPGKRKERSKIHKCKASTPKSFDNLEATYIPHTHTHTHTHTHQSTNAIAQLPQL